MERTVDEFKNHIKSILKDCRVALYFLGKDDEIYKPNLSSEALERVADLFKTKLTDSIVANEDFSIVALSNLDNRKNVLAKFDYKEAHRPPIFDKLDKLFDSPSSYPDYKQEDLKGAFISLSSHSLGQKILIYKQFFEVATFVKQSKSLASLIFQDNQFKVFENELLKIDPNYVFFRTGDEYYINSVDILIRSLGFKESIVSEAINAVEKIRLLDLVDNIERLNKRIKDEGKKDKGLAFSRKLMRCGQHSLVFKKNLTSQNIMTFIKKHPEISETFSYTPDGSKIFLRNQNEEKQLLRVLNDDYLLSELTAGLYQTEAKDLLQ